MNLLKIEIRYSNGNKGTSAGCFANEKNCHRALKTYKRIAALDNNAIVAWRIYNRLTNETIEQSGRL